MTTNQLRERLDQALEAALVASRCTVNPDGAVKWATRALELAQQWQRVSKVSR